MNNQTTRQAVCSTDLLSDVLNIAASVGSVIGLLSTLDMVNVPQGIIWNIVAVILWFQVLVLRKGR